MGPSDVWLIDMGTHRTTAEKIIVVNVVLLMICVPLLLWCLVQQLWFPGLVFAMLSFSNGYQLWSAKRAAPPE